MMMKHPHMCRADWMIALAFLVLLPCLAGIWYVDHHRANELRKSQVRDAWARYDSSLQACLRGNVLRTATNTQTSVLQALAEHSKLPGSSVETLRLIPLINCDNVVPSPTSKRPS